MKVYKNFLNKEEFNNLKNIFESPLFPWYYQNGVSYSSKTDTPYDFQFVHFLYTKDEINSDYYQYLKPILNKLKIFTLIRAKINLSTRVSKITTHEYHTDILDKPRDLKMKTGLYYFTNSNGYTKFKNGKKIECEENKFVEFDSNLEHTSSFGSNTNRRIVLNLNYIQLD